MLRGVWCYVTPKKIDRIDSRGNIREHLTIDDRTTICGLKIGMRQTPCDNGACRRCDRIFAAQCQKSTRQAS